MGDISAEPSMEDILASIKRVIKEGEAPAARRPIRATPEPPRGEDEAVLELDAKMTAAEPAPAPLSSSPLAPPAASSPATPHAAAATPAPAPTPSVSPATVEATRATLDTLSRLLVKPEPGSDGTLEGLVRELLRPMLSAWLDRNLPPLVEQMVAREIAKITAATR